MSNYSGKVREPMVDGVKVRMAGEEFQIPAINFKAWAELDEKINEVQKGLTGGELGPVRSKMIEIVSRAMRINYPDITEAQVEELLDLRNMVQAWCASIGVEMKTKGDRSGEAAPAQAG